MFSCSTIGSAGLHDALFCDGVGRRACSARCVVLWHRLGASSRRTDDAHLYNPGDSGGTLLGALWRHWQHADGGGMGCVSGGVLSWCHRVAVCVGLAVLSAAESWPW